MTPTPNATAAHESMLRNDEESLEWSDIPVITQSSNPLNEGEKVAPNSVAATSHVNGIGLWRSWQRSFRRPLDALLDLVDNAVDANQGRGRIRVSQTMPNREDQGILMVNSFPKDSYKEMHQILEVFSSQKEQTAIGENGVGVKQASANLSDFTVVVTLKGTRFQVGFLCISLQQQEGIHIPSFTIDGNWEDEIEALCESDSPFYYCMEFMGGRRPDELSPDHAARAAYRAAGQDRLLELMGHMAEFNQNSEDCVFALLLDQLRIQQSAESLLNELKKVLPSTYLHLQSNQCDILIQNEELTFQYWERRLVELTYFPIRVGPNVPVFTLDKENVDFPKESNQLRVFMGFDPLRVANNETQTSTASLYIYSRKCGRLIKHTADCRNELNLSAGGTAFCQGLTVILDDFHSTLPLTPTKQDVAWADEKNGDIYRRNIMAWLKAVTSTYYDYYFQRFVTKGALGEGVRAQEVAAKSLQYTKDYITPLADELLFNAFSGLHWTTRVVQGGGRIVLRNKQGIAVENGPGTLIRLSCPKSMPAAASSEKQNRRQASSQLMDFTLLTNGSDDDEPKRNKKSPKERFSLNETVITSRRVSQQGGDALQMPAKKGPEKKQNESLARRQGMVTSNSAVSTRRVIANGSEQGSGRSRRVLSSAAAQLEVAVDPQPMNKRKRDDAFLPNHAVLPQEPAISKQRGDKSSENDQEWNEELRNKDKIIAELEQSNSVLHKELKQLKEALAEKQGSEAMNQQLRNKDDVIEELEQSNLLLRKEMKQLNESSAEKLETLLKQIRQLQSENRDMKDELDRKNEQLLVLEEELG